MLVLVDCRSDVLSAYEKSFERAGASVARFAPREFLDWLRAATRADLDAVEAFLIGAGEGQRLWPAAIRARADAPVIALVDAPSLKQTLELFAAGVDDVTRKPVDAREILARVGAIRRRSNPRAGAVAENDVRVFFDGRDPEIAGAALPLPRRERRVLEHLVANAGKRVSRAQVFQAVYGLFDESIDERVVESHVSKLRRKLRERLGYDPVESRRHLGYTFAGRRRAG